MNKYFQFSNNTSRTKILSFKTGLDIDLCNKK